MLVVSELLKVKPNKIIQKPFLEYLLYKYPCCSSSYSNLAIFPFRILGKDTLKQATKKLMNDLNYKNVDCLGYIQNRKGIFLFYEIPYKKYKTTLHKKIPNCGGLLFTKYAIYEKYLIFLFIIP